MILEIRCFLRDRKIIDYLQDRLETARKVLIAPLASPHGPRFLLGYPIDRHPFQISQISGGRDSGKQIQTDSLLWEKGIQVRHSTHCLWAHFLAIHHRSGSVPSPHPPLTCPSSETGIRFLPCGKKTREGVEDTRLALGLCLDQGRWGRRLTLAVLLGFSYCRGATAWGNSNIVSTALSCEKKLSIWNLRVTDRCSAIPPLYSGYSGLCPLNTILLTSLTLLVF